MPKTQGYIPSTNPVWGYQDASGAEGSSGLLAGPTDPNELPISGLPGIPLLYMMGHSYANFDVANPYFNWNSDNTLSPRILRPRGDWAQVLSDTLNLSASGTRWITASVPAVGTAANDATTILGVTTGECQIDGIWYVPAAAVTGAATNSRTLQLEIPAVFGPTIIANLPLVAGTNLTAFTGTGVLPVGVNTVMQFQQARSNLAFAFRNGSNVELTPIHNNIFQWGNPGIIPGGTPLVWVSLHVGTGITDPGGIVIIRLSERVRNANVGGSSLVDSGLYSGGWGTAMNLRPQSKLPGLVVNVTATTAAGNGVTVTCDNLPQSVVGNVVFDNGAVLTTTSGGAINATTIVGNLTAPGVAAGNHGVGSSTQSPITGQWCYQPNMPGWTSISNWGINDAGAVTLDLSAYRESARAVMAMMLCPFIAWNWHSAGNMVTANGSGTWGNSPAGMNLSHFPIDGAAKQLLGPVTPTNPTLTIRLAPGAMDGDFIDLFFAALVGSNLGYQASITLDGTYVATIDAHNIAPNTAQTVNSLTATMNGTTAVTATGTGGNSFTDPGASGVTRTSLMEGRYVTGTSIAAGTYMKAIASATAATLSQAASGSTTNAITLIPWIPMVKRIPATPGVAHTIVITFTGMDPSPAAAWFMGYGVESNNPRATFIWQNIAKIVNTTTYPVGNTDNNVAALNQAVGQVVSGSAPTVGVNTQEPAFPKGSVIIADVDSAFNKNPNLFTVDGLHPNERGMQVIAQVVYNALVKNASLASLSSR